MINTTNLSAEPVQVQISAKPGRLALVIMAALAMALAVASPALAKGRSKSTSSVRSWLRLHDAVFFSLQTDLQVISTDAANGSVTAITAACQQLSADLGTIRRLPPIPDRLIERNWSKALRDFERGASDCVQGIVKDHPRLARRYGSLLRSGVKEVDMALASLRAGRFLIGKA
jgi:hypothetical protein